MDGAKAWVRNPIITTPYCMPFIYNEKPFDTTPYIYCTNTNSIGNTVIEMSEHIIGEYQGDK